MKEVSKDEFERFYFELGGGQATGWTRDYWESMFNSDDGPPRTFLVTLPPTPEHSRMFIVSDSKAGEVRMFFMTEDDEESFFDYPGRES